MQRELWLLVLWFLMQALKRTCESAHHKVSALLKESLGRFDSTNRDELMPAPDTSEVQQEGARGTAASIPDVSANPSMVGTVPPSEIQTPVVLGLR